MERKTRTSQNFDNLVKEVLNENTTGERLQELAQKSMELARLVADNPITPPELLKNMARRRDKTILANLTANPNTPTEVLFKLGKRFPEHFLKNPIFSLLLLENPNFFNEMPLKALEKLQEYVLNRLSNSDVVQNSEGLTPDFVLQQLVKHKDTSIRCSIARHPHAPVSLLEQLTSDSSDYVRHNVAINMSTPVYLLEKLASDTDTYVRYNVAKNPSTPLYILERFANENNYNVNEGIVYNPQSPTYLIDIVLGKLEQRQYGEYTLAEIARTCESTYVLEKLAISNIRRVRNCVAENAKAPAEILEQMSQSLNEHWLVLRGIARNRNTPVEILKQIVGDRRKSIRAAAIDNLNRSKLK